MTNIYFIRVVLSRHNYSETWEPPQYGKKNALGEKKAILGGTLGIPGYSRSNSRNLSHDLIYVKTLFSEQLSERLSDLVGRQNFSPNSRNAFFKIGVVRARLNLPLTEYPRVSPDNKSLRK